MELRNFKFTFAIFSNNSNFIAGNETNPPLSEGPYQTVEVVIIILAAGCLSLVTIIGNILVILAIKINRNLQTINNYFIFSLACADLITGVSTMNLFTVYLVVGYWPLGPVVCDIWLILDYVVCSASVMNLLIISFDRYFCVTKPLSYPARRTTRMAFMMIAAAWAIAFAVWSPAILFPQFIIGERIVEEHECYIQFMSDVAFTLITSCICTYLPVAIMTFLYWRISRASKSRVKMGEHKLKQDNQSSTKAGNHITMPCGDDNVKTHYTERSQNGGTGGVDEEEPSAPVHPERNKIAETPAGYEENPTAHSLNATTPKQRNEIAKAPAGYEGNRTARGPKGTLGKQHPKKKTPPSRESKVTRMIMAILIAFVVTWTPYHMLAFINTFCSTCIPAPMWTVSYWLCYINSTINPVCYALCNVTFKKTFRQLLLCQYKDIRLGR